MTPRFDPVAMAYDDVGRGETILLVHGFPLSRRIWRPQMEALRSSYRIIAPDLRGHGETEAPDGVYGMAEMASDLRRLLDHLGIETAVLGGHSMGGYVAFSFYRAWPERARALILVDTRAEPDNERGRRGRAEMIRLAKERGAEAVAAEMLPRLISKETLEGRPELVDEVRTIMEATPVSGLAGALQGMADRPDSVPLLKEISVPTLILVGERDVLTPLPYADRMHADISESHLELIPGAGHLPSLEAPEAVNDAIRLFLDQIQS
ncbi:MAG: alpha/beta fold hydrolase [Anaerolineae bacterium]